MIATPGGYGMQPEPEEQPDFETLTVEEMQARAEDLRDLGLDAVSAGVDGSTTSGMTVATTLWAVAAQICDRLDALLEYEAARDAERTDEEDAA